ncbi:MULTISPECIES: flagellar type III secretion system pore protein FliP [unclassified Azospirillum]|uniref:flagellar type III secretion system pore protein FliP n=1 Tax=unclassified Azospirillum TaxID=2630922 RepID=UPI000B6DFC49|nr:MULTISPECIES: flagellar type III secretion system pore protein FliP [unclassified Azospirillum]SNS96009.1 flagellar biosynthetic protein FliP [Azospirillum sp. RU38E]SNT12322.1 flagellar biosynthetic protein FliP [Azospirillum sp. RU37A]
MSLFTTMPGWLRGLALALPALLLAVLPAAAQSFSLDMGDGPSSTGRIIQFVALLTVLSLAPSILIMMTCFVRITIVLSFLRSAMGTMQVPPNQVLVSLAMFLTFFIMAPTLQASYQNGIVPLMNEEVDEMTAFKRAIEPFHAFMTSHVRERDLQLFMDISKTPPVAEPKDVPIHVLIPAFMLTELKRSFEIGFLIFVPFLIIDMVVSSVLMSMGMMMLPPAMIALPFKLIFFVLIDGWYLLVGSLVQSFG